jgi:hypothetical protein
MGITLVMGITLEAPQGSALLGCRSPLTRDATVLRGCSSLTVHLTRDATVLRGCSSLTVHTAAPLRVGGCTGSGRPGHRVWTAPPHLSGPFMCGPFTRRLRVCLLRLRGLPHLLLRALTPGGGRVLVGLRLPRWRVLSLLRRSEAASGQ